MSEALAFGEYELSDGARVKFKPRGYPFGLRREWRESRDTDWLIDTLLKHLDGWTLTTTTGEAASPDRAGLDLVEGAVVVEIIRAFTQWLLVDSGTPPKNS